MNISAVIIKRIQEGNKSLGMLENMRFEWEIFTFSPVVYITVDFKKVESELFYAGSKANVSRDKQGYQNSLQT